MAQPRLQEQYLHAHPGASHTNATRVLRNTYCLLSMTLLFSAAMTGLTMAMNWPYPGWIVTLLGYFALLFAVEETQNSGLGLFFVFALTGFLGYTLGPIVDLYLTVLPNGGQVVMLALGGTGALFLGLSGYALMSGKRFNRWAGALFAGVLVAFLLGIAAIVFQLPALSLAVSAMFILLMAGVILFQTGEIVHGGETNYISATVTLYVSIYNIFLSLLQILGFTMGDD